MKFKGLLIFTALILMSKVTFAYYEDDVISGRYIEIKGKDFVADTFCGVNAYYNVDERKPSCYELVKRFYDTLYPEKDYPSSKYSFEETDKPREGDYIYIASNQRKNNGSQHYAIVKEYKNGEITLFEQNWFWDNKAGVDRKVKFPSDNYTVYAFVDNNGNRAPSPLEIYSGEEKTTQKETKKKTTKVKKPTVEIIDYKSKLIVDYNSSRIFKVKLKNGESSYVIWKNNKKDEYGSGDEITFENITEDFVLKAEYVVDGKTIAKSKTMNIKVNSMFYTKMKNDVIEVIKQIANKKN